MKKLVFKLFLCLLPVALWYLYMNCASFYFMDEEYPYWMQQKDYINKSDEYNEMIVLGDSIAKAAVRPNSVSGHKTANLSLGGASVVEMYYSLEDYLENHQPPRAVLCMFGINHYAGGDCYISRTLYFHYLDGSRLRELDQAAERIGSPSFWNQKEVKRLTLEYALWNPKLYLPAVFNSGFTGRYEQNISLYNQLSFEKGWMIFGTDEGNSEPGIITEYDSFAADPVNDYYLGKMIDLCTRNSIQFILEQAPVKASSLALIASDVEQSYFAYFEELKSRYSQICVNTAYAVYEDSMFGDPNHMNAAGAQAYTKFIMDTYGDLLDTKA